jgi:hypothetical protein
LPPLLCHKPGKSKNLHTGDVKFCIVCAGERFTFGTKERERDLKPEPGKGGYIPKADID